MMKRTKRSRKQLRVNKETVRNLTNGDLRNVGGGDDQDETITTQTGQTLNCTPSCPTE